ncbi:MAG: hypothetical protein JOY90_37775 [Bradyrhizobium sp.]|uniref:hypothetical protein n=1 Tax=Bradyrhizobium sp. TaxID=376 RepID=UPI001DCD77A6|nr:hypothetical protein [Bradyrhizobium sp.]MBV9566159.1 hypothetical protein [Bradyrhizobium sp.]
MTSLAPPLSICLVRPHPSHKLALALALTALADSLFYGERMGISVVVSLSPCRSASQVPHSASPCPF